MILWARACERVTNLQENKRMIKYVVRNWTAGKDESKKLKEIKEQEKVSELVFIDLDQPLHPSPKESLS